MRHAIHRIAAAWAAAAVLLAGCGGGGARPDAQAPTEVTISGIAATGKPFVGAGVVIYDRNGNALNATPAIVGDDGSYRITIPASAAAPLVVEAVREDATLVSTFAETKTTHLNITPLTNLIAARLAPNGDPLSLRANASVVTPEALAARVAEVKAILQPVTEAVGDSVDPLTGVFAADGTGHDKVMDVVDISIRNAGSVSNIEITVRGSAEGISRQFTSADATVAPLPAVPAGSLPPDGINTMVDALLARMSACYAVPFEQRVRGVSSASVNAVTGGPADVLAPECRTMFVGDDPATFFSSGNTVGRDASNAGAFSSLFRRGATGVVFSNGRFEFLRNNDEKDVVFTYRSTDAQGNVLNDQLIARNEGGTLKLVGNNYAYAASVRPYAQDREFLNQPAASYLSTGYDINIANRLDGSGNPVFSKVVVTTPRATTLTFVPNGGRSALSIQRPNGSLTQTSVVRLAGAFKSSSTSGSPADFESSLFFASPAFDSAQIREIPEQGVWRLEFFHADTSQANVVQNYRTVSRAATLEELAATPLAQLTEAAKAEIRAETAATGRVTFGPPSTSSPNVADLSTAGGGDFWVVTPPAQPPTSITVFGAGPDPDGSGPLRRASFDDGINVAPSARKAVINCSRLGNADTHCDGTLTTQFAEGTVIDTLQLFATTPRMAGLAKMNAFYYLLPR
ncbi:MAG TPA: carboxypeptidase regulatory-like domain-containing protein [Ramlibacter sp.]